MSMFTHSVTDVNVTFPQGARAYRRAARAFNRCPSCPEAAARLMAAAPQGTPVNTNWYSSVSHAGPAAYAQLYPRVVQAPQYVVNNTLAPLWHNTMQNIHPYYQQYVHPCYQYAVNNVVRPCVNAARHRIPWL